MGSARRSRSWWWRPGLSMLPALLLALFPCLPEAADAGERRISTRIAGYEGAPVVVRSATGEVIHIYERPDDLVVMAAAKGAAKSPQRVRYINRLNEEVRTVQLHGTLTLKNATNKTAEAIRIQTILFNAFRERVGSYEEVVQEPLGPFRIKQIEWSRAMPTEDIYELYVVITKIRFSDGDVWSPTEELVFSP